MDIKQKQMANEEQKQVIKLLAESAAKPGCMFLEVGSWMGESTLLLANTAKQHGGHVVCVDWWKGNRGTDLTNIASKIDVQSIFWAKICKEKLEHVVIPIKSESLLASKFIKDDTFDIVFLDADHRYNGILNDIKNYSSKVKKKNGILCGHDCEGYINDYELSFLEKGKNIDYFETVHCGVVLAVARSFEEYSINHSIWSVKHICINNKWEPVNIDLRGLENRKQTPAPALGITQNHSLVRYGMTVYAVPFSIDPASVKKEEELIK
ncbi:class I SAM-dependent methyltransferase, partial [bacterium]